MLHFSVILPSQVHSTPNPALFSDQILTHYGEVELHVPGGGVPVIHPAPVHSLIQQSHVLDHQRREALRRRDPEPRSLPESKWRLR